MDELAPELEIELDDEELEELELDDEELEDETVVQQLQSPLGPYQPMSHLTGTELGLHRTCLFAASKDRDRRLLAPQRY